MAGNDRSPARYGLWLVDFAEWLESYDPDGGDPGLAYPTGTVTATADASRARAFDSAMDALGCWRQQSSRTPTRPDGHPNRPLTAFTVEPRRLP